MEDDRNVTESLDLIARVRIELVENDADDTDTRFQVYRSHYKKRTHSGPAKLRETRVLFASSGRDAARAFMQGYVEGHRNARST